MSQGLNVEVISVDCLLDKVRDARSRGCRLVQISATRLPEQVELTYSFDVNSHLTNLRVLLPGSGPKVPSISSVYPCVLLYENEIHDLFNVQVDGMAVDFHGQLYQTAVKFPFGTVKAPSKAPAVPAIKAPATPLPSAAGSTMQALSGGGPAVS